MPDFSLAGAMFLELDPADQILSTIRDHLPRGYARCIGSSVHRELST
jgi:hypothetical protein